MKKELLIILCAFFTISARAQTDNFRLGIQMSPSVSWISAKDNNISSTGSNIGLRIGAIGEFHLSENSAITTGVNIAFNQGGQLEHLIGGNFLINSELSNDLLNTGQKPLPDGTSIRYNLQYVEIPFSYKIRTNESGYLRYFLEVPVLSFGFGTQSRGSIEGTGINVEKENIKKDVNTINMYWGFGAGVEYALSESNSLVGGLFFTSSMIDITQNDGFKAFPNPNEDPGNPSDDYFTESENSKGTLGAITLRIALLF